jgi:6-phosphofructokinase 1
VGRALENHRIDGLLIVGGWMAYKAVYNLFSERDRYPAFKIPMICLPATIDNNVPGSELSIGADTALNVIVEALDRIKQSAMAARRCFVVETMGRYCGYLALMSGLAGGAERVYLHEEGVTLKDLQADVERMVESFRGGRRLYLTIRNEHANPRYTTDFMCALFEEEGRDLFDVRRAVLGHIQQGGNPSPYDRILATRLAAHCIDFLSGELERGSAGGAFIGLVEGKVTVFPFKQMSDMVDWTFRRPREQWWLELRPIIQAMAQPAVVEARDR